MPLIFIQYTSDTLQMHWNDLTFFLDIRTKERWKFVQFEFETHRHFYLFAKDHIKCQSKIPKCPKIHHHHSNFRSDRQNNIYFSMTFMKTKKETICSRLSFRNLSYYTKRHNIFTIGSIECIFKSFERLFLKCIIQGKHSSRSTLFNYENRCFQWLENPCREETFLILIIETL